MSDEVLVPFFARNPPRLEVIDLQSTIIGIETVIAMHQFTTCRAPFASMSLRSVDLRNCQQLFSEQYTESSNEDPPKTNERTQLLITFDPSDAEFWHSHPNIPGDLRLLLECGILMDQFCL